AGDEREVEDGPHLRVQREQEAGRDQRSDHRAQVVPDALEAEGRAPPRLVDRPRDQRVPRRRSDAGAQAVAEAPGQHRRPGRGTASITSTVRPWVPLGSTAGAWDVLARAHRRSRAMPTEIGRAEVRRLADDGAVLVEVLPAEEYEAEHIRAHGLETFRDYHA